MSEQTTDTNSWQFRQMNDDDEDTIDLLELAGELLHRWYIIAAAVVIGAVIAFVYSAFLVTPIYSSTSKLYIFSRSTSLTSITDLQLSSSLTEDYVELITNRPIVEQVIDNLGLNLTYAELSSKTTVSNPSDTHMLYITIKDADSSVAKAIADEYADVASQAIGEMMSQDPPNIISYGYDDGNPVNVNTFRTVLIGAFIGFALSAAFVIIAHMLNDLIKSPDDFGTKVQTNLLGTLPKEEALVNFGYERKHKSKRK